MRQPYIGIANLWQTTKISLGNPRIASKARHNRDSRQQAQKSSADDANFE